MKKTFLICLAVTLGSTVFLKVNCFAQSALGKIYPGYVVTNANDTIKGFIKLTNKIRNQRKAFFYTSPNDKQPKQEYKPDDLKAYLVGERIYESMAYGDMRKNVKNFLLRTVTGGISVYYYYMDETDLATKNDRGGTDINFGIDESKLKEEMVVKKVGGEPINFNSPKFAMGFRGAMSELVKDYPELSKKISGKEKGYGLGNRDQIIMEYNEWFISSKQ